MKERIQRILIDKRLSASKFAEKIEVQPSGISHILSGRNKPGMDFIVKCLTVFPDINPEWFVLGTGGMYRSTGKDSSDNHNQTAPYPTDATQVQSDTADTSSEPTEHSEPYSSEKGLFAPCDSFIRDMNELPEVTDPNDCASENRDRNPKRRRICRVMVFYSDHTVESFDYSETV